MACQCHLVIVKSSTMKWRRNLAADRIADDCEALLPWANLHPHRPNLSVIFSPPPQGLISATACRDVIYRSLFSSDARAQIQSRGLGGIRALKPGMLACGALPRNSLRLLGRKLRSNSRDEFVQEARSLAATNDNSSPAPCAPQHLAGALRACGGGLEVGRSD